MKVLIIEDSEALRRGLSVGLNNLGFTVDETGDGSVGLTMALNQQYDLIVLDLMLPNVDGMSICDLYASKGFKPRSLSYLPRH